MINKSKSSTMMSDRDSSKLYIAAFGGFRSIPPKAGGAGADKFALELYPRLIERGHSVIAYVRSYPGETCDADQEYKGMKLHLLQYCRESRL